MDLYKCFFFRKVHGKDRNKFSSMLWKLVANFLLLMGLLLLVQKGSKPAKIKIFCLAVARNTQQVKRSE